MKNEKSDTPETDAMHAMRLIEFRGAISQYFEMAALSRKLERERNEWKAKFTDLDNQLKCELRDPNGTIWECAAKLQKDLDETREQLTIALARIEELHILVSRERDIAERERNEARAYADKLAQGLPVGMLPKDVENLRDANAKLATEVEKWKMRFTAFAATQAADYGRDRYGEGCMHFTHYDLLKEAGARMDSFKRCGDPLITP
jgi:uncharacterized membrane protein